MEFKIINGILVFTFFLLISFLISWIFLPKSHQGYYLGVKDGTNSEQIFPVYRIYNNWKFFPDTLAYETADKGECLQLFGTLRKNQ